MATNNEYRTLIEQRAARQEFLERIYRLYELLATGSLLANECQPEMVTAMFKADGLVAQACFAFSLRRDADGYHMVSSMLDYAKVGATATRELMDENRRLIQRQYEFPNVEDLEALDTWTGCLPQGGLIVLRDFLGIDRPLLVYPAQMTFKEGYMMVTKALAMYRQP